MAITAVVVAEGGGCGDGGGGTVAVDGKRIGKRGSQNPLLVTALLFTF